MLHIPGLFIAKTIKGRGVFTAQDLQPGETIEVCPVIILPKNDIPHIDKTRLFEYYFLWPDQGGTICIALGYGSLYNHGNSPNAKIILDLTAQEMIVESTDEITAGDEILINYLDDTKRTHALWFIPLED